MTKGPHRHHHRKTHKNREEFQDKLQAWLSPNTEAQWEEASHSVYSPFFLKLWNVIADREFNSYVVQKILEFRAFLNHQTRLRESEQRLKDQIARENLKSSASNQLLSLKATPLQAIQKELQHKKLSELQDLIRKLPAQINALQTQVNTLQAQIYASALQQTQAEQVVQNLVNRRADRVGQFLTQIAAPNSQIILTTITGERADLSVEVVNDICAAIRQTTPTTPLKFNPGLQGKSASVPVEDFEHHLSGTKSTMDIFKIVHRINEGCDFGHLPPSYIVANRKTLDALVQHAFTDAELDNAVVAVVNLVQDQTQKEYELIDASRKLDLLTKLLEEAMNLADNKKHRPKHQ